MPTTEQPGAISLLLQQVGVSIGAGPYRTLNFHSGATVVDAGGGVAQIDISGGGGSIPDGSVTLAKLADMAQSTFIGRHAGGGTGVPEALTSAQVKTALAIAAGTDVSGLAAVALSGSASDITTGTLPAAQIAAGSLALSKLANQAAATILGNNTGGAAAPIALTAAQTKTLLAIATADVSGLVAIASSGSATDLTSGSIPSGRYASNTMVAATFAAAATQRVLGRNTAGAGAGEEVTASQLFDWISNTNGVLLTRTGGAWGAIANWTTDSGDLVAAVNASPAAPISGTKLFGALHAGRNMPAFLAPVGAKSFAQPFLGTKSYCAIVPQPGTATFTSFGFPIATTGTVTARALASTSFATGTRRTGIVSGAVGGNLAIIRPSSAVNFAWRGNVAGAGGFHLVWRFLISDAALVGTANMFVGIQPAAAPTDVDPATLINLIGVGCTNGDTVLQLYAADGTARTKTAFSASYPCNTITTDVYEFSLYAPANGSDVRYELARLNTGDRASGTISSSTQMPANTVMLAPQAWRSNGGAASAVGLDIGGMYLESDN